MVSRQIITPSGQDDVPPHEHEASDISGTYNFARILNAIIDGDITVTGELRVNGGADVIIGDADTPNTQVFFDNIQSHFNLRETDDPDYPDKILIYDVNGGIGRIVWRDQTGVPVSTDLLHFNQDGTVEVKVGLHLVNGTAAAPALAFENDTTTGLFRDTAGEIGVTSGGSEVARFTGTAGKNLQGLEWTTWSPTLGGITVGDGTVTARYVQIGDTVHCEFKFIQGSTGGVTGSVSVSPPVTPAQIATGMWDVILSDAGSITHGVTWLFDSSTFLVRYRTVSGSTIEATNLSSTAPFTWAEGDRISFTATYEAA